jgi:hypothetical protein
MPNAHRGRRQNAIMRYGPGEEVGNVIDMRCSAEKAPKRMKADCHVFGYIQSALVQTANRVAHTARDNLDSCACR